MNDRRVAVSREAMESLMDSLAATSRLQRWDASDPVPESLRQSASQLDKRVDSAKKLAASSFVGSALVVSKLNGISDAIRRLVRAREDFATRLAESPQDLNAALDALDAEIDEVKSSAERWL
jgi:phage shock protein A